MNASIQAVTLTKLVHGVPLARGLVLFKVGFDEHDIKILNLLFTSNKTGGTTFGFQKTWFFNKLIMCDIESRGLEIVDK
ncbi:MAG: hypothetical protein R6T98_12460 [Desulfatiglandales bacterium]